MEFTCELRHREAQPTLCIRTRTSAVDLSSELARAYGLISRYMADVAQEPAGPPYTAFYSRDEQDLDVEIGIPVPELVPGQGEIQAGEIPEGWYASCLYIGPYEGIGPAYDALIAFIADEGRAPLGVAYEFYISDPSQTPPADREILVIFPLARQEEDV